MHHFRTSAFWLNKKFFDFFNFFRKQTSLFCWRLKTRLRKWNLYKLKVLEGLLWRILSLYFSKSRPTFDINYTFYHYIYGHPILGADLLFYFLNKSYCIFSGCSMIRDIHLVGRTIFMLSPAPKIRSWQFRLAPSRIKAAPIF